MTTNTSKPCTPNHEFTLNVERLRGTPHGRRLSSDGARCGGREPAAGLAIIAYLGGLGESQERNRNPASGQESTKVPLGPPPNLNFLRRSKI